MKKILITGGTGLLGKALIKKLLQRGYEVRVLTRTKRKDSPYQSYLWNLESGEFDITCLESVDAIIHLAGAGVIDQKWTKNYKQEILDSRVKSANMLFEAIKKSETKPEVFISTSGVGYYGAVSVKKTFEENDAAGNDFVATVCKQWEQAAIQFETLNIRTAIFRTGVVLSKDGGALLKMMKLARMKLLSNLGSGTQIIPWIGVNDWVNATIFSLENPQMKGIYNSVAANVTNQEMTKQINKCYNNRFLLPSVPKFMIRLLFGERANLILEGSKVSNNKLLQAGFEFENKELEEVIRNFTN
ncbi:MAG: TIGR01777 family protein [Flavobacteriales bacterium]|nr:TIGR01777 family protein [Flavobacteriales bacterium]